MPVTPLGAGCQLPQRHQASRAPSGRRSSDRSRGRAAGHRPTWRRIRWPGSAFSPCPRGPSAPHPALRRRAVAAGRRTGRKSVHIASMQKTPAAVAATWMARASPASRPTGFSMRTLARPDREQGVREVEVVRRGDADDVDSRVADQRSHGTRVPCSPKRPLRDQRSPGRATRRPGSPAGVGPHRPDELVGDPTCPEDAPLERWRLDRGECAVSAGCSGTFTHPCLVRCRYAARSR